MAVNTVIFGGEIPVRVSHHKRLDLSHTSQSFSTDLGEKISQKIEITNGLIERTDYEYPITVHRKKYSRPNRYDEYKKNTQKRSLSMARSVLLGNFDTTSFFLTLTFRPTNKFDTKSLTACNWRKERFVKNLHKYYPEAKYVIVPELHKSGVIHYHAIVSLPRKLSDRERSVLWSYGFTTMKPIRDCRGLLYLTKYLGKSFDEPTFKGMRRFYTSENLAHPEVLQGSELYLVNQFITSWKLKPVLEVTYSSPFQGRISYKAYVVNKSWVPLIRWGEQRSLIN